VLDWRALLRRQTFHTAVFRPSVMRANGHASESAATARLGDEPLATVVP